MVLVDNSDRVLEISRGFTRLFGYRPAEARGKLVNELVASGDLAADASTISGKVLAGEAVSKETVRLARDGKAIPVALIAYPIQYGNRQVGVVAVYRDITAQKEAREQFREFLQNVGAMALILDTRGRIAFANRFFLESLGASVQETAGKDYFDLCFAEEIRETMRHDFESLLSTGGSSSGTSDLETPSGTRRISWSTSVLRDLYGRVSGAAGLGVDITDQEVSRQALDRRQKILEAVSFSADRFLRTGNWRDEMGPVLEKLGRAAEADKAWTYAAPSGGKNGAVEFEWSAGERSGSADLVSGMRDPRLASLLAANEVVSGSTEKMPPGIRGPLLDRGTGSLILVPVFLGTFWWGCIGFEDPSSDRIWSEEEKGVLGAAADILGAAIQRREFERQLRSNMAQYAALVDNLSAGVLAESTDRTILYANDALCSIFGMASPVDLIGRNFSEASEALESLFVDPGAFLEATSTCVDGGMQRQHQEFNLRNGKILERDYVPISIQSENYGHLWLYRDVTERRREEGNALRAQKLESLGALAGGIAHDFNNLLTGILGNVSLARMAVDDPVEVARRLEDAEKAAFRARALTHQLLTFSRGGEPVKRLVDLRGMIRDTSEFVLSGGRCICEYRIRRDLWKVEADEGLLAQVITNLVMNACQAMPGGGRLTVSASNLDLASAAPPVPPGRHVHITVADEGSGIAPENLERIFDPYFSTRPEGLGLGLAACYSIVSRHGGYIFAESEPGSGAIFHIYLPASAIPADEADEDGATAEVTGCGRVLVVDDDEMILSVSGGILATLGYRSETAGSCSEAVEKLSAAIEADNPFCAVILDLTMPDGPCGVETLKQLRALDPGIPAIVSSGYSTNSVLSNPGEFGFDGVVSKPYRVEDLGAALDRVLRSGRHQDEGRSAG